MTIGSPSLLTTTLDNNGLNLLIRVVERINKKDPTIFYLQEIQFKFRHTEAESESMGKDIPCKLKTKAWVLFSH